MSLQQDLRKLSGKYISENELHNYLVILGDKDLCKLVHFSPPINKCQIKYRLGLSNKQYKKWRKEQLK